MPSSRSRSRSPSPSSPEDIATAMGFSSFGAKPNPPKKKRRLADQPNTEGSGTNNTPLGVRTRRTPGTQQEGVRGAKHQSAGTSTGTETGGARGQEQRSEAQDKRTGSDGLGIPTPDPDTLAAAALGERAGMPLETGLLPRYSDWGDGGYAESGGLRDDDAERKWRGQQGPSGGGVGVGVGEEMRTQGKRGDGEWDWQALRKGVVDERGDVVFYDGSFVEDPWRGLGFRGGRGEGG